MSSPVAIFTLFLGAIAFNEKIPNPLILTCLSAISPSFKLSNKAFKKLSASFSVQ